MRKFNSIMVTGGAGFIGCNFIRYLLSDASKFSGKIINLDKLTYAGNLLSLQDISKYHEGTRYFFEHGDICDSNNNIRIMKHYDVDAIVHLAAESHVDRSIHGPQSFIQTNLLGTFSLLEACRNVWGGRQDVLFHHVSTDEVYGSLGDTGFFTELTPYDPRSPYSATKAGSDHLVMAYHYTFGLPVTVTNCSNNYGPYQFPEKLIPLMIMNMVEKKPLPVYGDGKNIRDWLYVSDHNSAVWTVIQSGRNGQRYIIGGENEVENIKLIKTLCLVVSDVIGKQASELESLITYVKDRPGHDRRYSIDCSKIKNELKWKQKIEFDEGLRKTAKWYLGNKHWVDGIRTGEYRKWIKLHYSRR